MSGFDFDALRDPDAPRPGARERSSVDARARQLHARTRRNRVAASATSIIAVAAIVTAVVAATHGAGPSLTVTGPSSTTSPATTANTTAPSAIADRLVPPTSIDNGLVVLPVTLPDGDTVTLRYPPALRLAQLGFSGGIGISGVEAEISYTTIAQAYRAETPITQYPGANGGSVPYLPGVRPIGLNGPRPADELAFQFGPWLVRVPNDNGMTPDQLATWARGLTGTVDANGYLLLHASAPLRVNNEFEGGFGNGDAANGDFLDLASNLYCGQPESYGTTPTRFTNGDGTHGVAWCDGNLEVHATGSTGFVNLVTTKLQVTPITPSAMSPNVTATTTTTPAALSSTAVSASFVSPDHGWVLRRNSEVDETTDGGSTWHAVGNIGAPTNFVRLRFADAQHGFAFSGEVNISTQRFMVTSDGGAHWKRTQAPFSSISDLAIARGVVYVVGRPANTRSFDGFRIWSTPVGTLHWSMDSVTIPAAAGPDSEQQLVFAGNGGWLVNDDRDASSGARLSPKNDRWSPWTPPCAGPAELAASTTDDLVLVCGPPFASDSTTSTIEFSHDSGTSFSHKSVLRVEDPLTPDPNTAVVADPDRGDLQRTTDGGVTWHDVAIGMAEQDVIDGGFTTSTQGFVIFGDGSMIMTYDAGATWREVTLP